MIARIGYGALETTVSGGTAFIPADTIDSDSPSSNWITEDTNGNGILDGAEDVNGDGVLDGLAESGSPYLTKSRRIVTLFTNTGAISIHPVNPQDIHDPADLDGDGVTQGSLATPEPDGIADDPYLFAETGEEAN